MGAPRWRCWSTAVGLVLAVAACGASEAVPNDGGVSKQAEQAGWVLAVRLPSTTIDTADAIPLETTLTWTGAQDRASIWGSGMGAVTFAYTEMGGARRTMDGVLTADCHQYDFVRGIPLAVQPGKGWVTDGNDPNLAFYQAWSNDPVLHLPPGSWHLDVGTDALLAPCDNDAPPLKLAIPIELTVR